MKNIEPKQYKMLAEELCLLYASSLTGEPFHSEYKKDKDTFRRLVTAEVKLKKELKEHYKELSNIIINQINWQDFQMKMLKADEFDDMVNYNYDEEVKSLTPVLIRNLSTILWLGGLSAEKDYKQDVDWTPTSDTLNTFINKKAQDLAKQLTETTESRVSTALRSSYTNNETIEEAIARVMKTVDDPRRAEVIARTESINAFADGRIEAGRIMGATHKEWSSTLNACKLCSPLNGVTVKIDDPFTGSILKPAAHPSCRCYIRLLFLN